MKWLYDLKIAIKLQSSFFLVAAIAGVIGWVGLSKVSQMKTGGATLYGARPIPMEDLAYANFGFLNARTDLLLANDQNAPRETAASVATEAENSPLASEQCCSNPKPGANAT
jgi:methyl-accepting chemotaxis protein